MSLTIIDGFDNRSNNPIDAKYIVANYAALATLQFKHQGMWRWVENVQNIYVLQNDLVTWKPLAIGKTIAKWVAGSYGLYDLVISAGALYESQKDANNSVPGSNSDWLKILGQKGDKGDPGTSGKSAYQLWLDNGHTGTLADFLNSLKGDKGDDGAPGPPGATGVGLAPWISTKSYDTNEMVRWGGHFWESAIDDNTSEPGDDDNWTIFSEGPAGPEFDMTAYIAAAPVYENEAEAVTGSIAPFTLYKTSTGELRYKLPPAGFFTNQFTNQFL